jgi:hypothetical protein
MFNNLVIGFQMTRLDWRRQPMGKLNLLDLINFHVIFSLWSGTVSTDVHTIKFRYFIGYYLESEPGKPPSLLVRQWETHLTPRTVMPAVESSKLRVCRANVNDVFGFNGEFIALHSLRLASQQLISYQLPKVIFRWTRNGQ